MNRVNRLHVPLFLASALLGGCGVDRSSSTTSETENVVMAREFIVDSILPVWLPLDTRPVVATLRLDASHLPFDSTDSSGRDLDLVDKDERPLPFEISYWDKTIRRGRIHVRIEDPRASLPSRIRLRWNRPLAVRSDAVSTWRGIAPDRRLTINSLLLDDFEDGDLASGLPSGSKWFVDAPQDSTRVDPPQVLPESDARLGNVLATSFVADRAKYRYVVLGLDLKSAAPLTFRAMDSLTMDVRGPTRLTVQLEHIGANPTRKAWVHLDLDSNWNRLAIVPGSFLPPDPSMPAVAGWDAVRDSINSLTFLLSGGSSVHIDNIRFHGLNRDDFR